MVEWLSMNFATKFIAVLGFSLLVNGFSQSAGSDRPGDGGSALNAQICDPTAIAIAHGSLYVAEGCFQTAAIRRIDLKTGAISTLTAISTGGNIADLSVDIHGDLIAADPVRNRILRISTADGSISVIAGTGDYGFSGDEGLAAKANLTAPYAIALDQTGNIFIADSGNSRIRKIDAQTGKITTVAGSGAKGITGDGDRALDAGLEWPTSIAIDRAGNLYIGQNTNDERLDRIRKVDAKTGLISTYTPTDLPPDAMLFDGQGNLIFVEAGRIKSVDVACIKRIDAATGAVSTIAGSTQSFSGDGGLAIKARLENPSALAFDESGNLYIADFVSHRIRRIRSKDGVIEIFAGNGEPHHAHVLM